MPLDSYDFATDGQRSQGLTIANTSQLSQAAPPTSPVEENAGTPQLAPVQSPSLAPSIPELARRASTSVFPSLPTIAIESTTHNVTRRQSKIAWNTSIAERLRSFPAKPVPAGYMSAPSDVVDTETEWEDATFLSSNSVPRLHDISSENLFSSEDDRVQPRGWTAAEKGKGRAEPLGFLSVRQHTISNASPVSSAGPSTTYLTPSTPPPPVPPLPTEFRPSAADKAQASALHVETQRSSLEDIPEGEGFVIAIVGPPKCGKSQFVWKGLKCWGLEFEPTATQFGGAIGRS